LSNHSVAECSVATFIFMPSSCPRRYTEASHGEGGEEEMASYNPVSKVSRAVLWLPVLAGFILSAQYAFAQGANARAVEPATQVQPCRNGPLEKNLMAPNTLPCNTQTAHRELTSRQIKKLAATAKSLEDRLVVARYYRTRAGRLEAQAAEYEEASAALEHGPAIKNLTAPTTAMRYQYLAKELRKEAALDRTLAGSHDQIAEALTPAQSNSH
jgi:hypothetical protein